MPKYLFLCVLLWCYCGFSKEPEALYLTWIHDPTTTMTIQWHTEETTSVIYYRQIGEMQWKEAEGSFSAIPHSNVLIHTLELQGLAQDTDYQFRCGNEPKVYQFKTMPSHSTRPIRFVVGGDAYYYEYLFRRMNLQIAKLDPDFIVVGGDIAYTHFQRSFFKGAWGGNARWKTFFSEWKKTMVGKDGRLIPILPVLGNHDLRKVKESSFTHIPLFFRLFAMPDPLKGYRVLDFGNYLSLIFLDSGHFSPIAGEQTKWLESVLQTRQTQECLMAVYHIAAFPSYYRFGNAGSQRIRHFWVPLFEKYGVDTAFENHNHAYKRTYRIKEEKIDPTGVQYLGDGSWGVAPRTPNKGLWYMAKTARVNSCWQVTLENDLWTFESFDNRGKPIEKITNPQMQPTNGRLDKVDGRIGQMDELDSDHWTMNKG